MKTLAVQVLREFRLVCNQTEADLKPAAVMVLRAEAPIMVSFQPRNA